LKLGPIVVNFVPKVIKELLEYVTPTPSKPPAPQEKRIIEQIEEDHPSCSVKTATKMKVSPK
jgi:hypothetical protein